MEARPGMVAEIVDNVRRIFQTLTELSRKVEQETGLTPAKLLAVKMLQNDPLMKISDLAKALYVHPATAVGLVDRLETKGLVQRKRSEKDRRVVHLVLTEKGREIVQMIPEMPPTHLLNGLESLNPAELETVAAGVEQLVLLLGAKEDPPHLLMSSEINIPDRKKAR